MIDLPDRINKTISKRKNNKQQNDIRAWEIGRRAIAICCAMNEAGKTGGSVTPDYGAAAAKKKTTVKKAATAAKKITTVKKAAPAAKKEGKKK